MSILGVALRAPSDYDYPGPIHALGLHIGAGASAPSSSIQDTGVGLLACGVWVLPATVSKSYSMQDTCVGLLAV